MSVYRCRFRSTLFTHSQPLTLTYLIAVDLDLGPITRYPQPNFGIATTPSLDIPKPSSAQSPPMSNEAHIRIDEGIKRGPKDAKHPQLPAKRPIEGDGWTIPEDLNPDTVLAEYLIAGKTSGIAIKYGLRRAALTRWLQKVRSKEWKEVQVVRALCTKEDGTEQLYDAVSALQLSRGRELLKASQFDLERLDPANWAQKQEITTHVQPVLNITVVAAASYPQCSNGELPIKEAEKAIDVINQEDAI